VKPVDSLGSSSLARLPVNIWLIGQESSIVQRRGRYTAASVRGHAGKMLPELARRLVETYTRSGDWVLDPMSGIGTLGVEAVTLGRHYVGIELVRRFAAWQQENLRRARERGAGGRYAVFQSDARRLHSRFPPGGKGRDRADPCLGWEPVDAIITSPPYGDRLAFRPRDRHSPFVAARLRDGRCRPGFVPGAYGPERENIGNLHGAAYRAATEHVYAGCFEVLRPGGLMILVLRSTRNGPCLQPLHHDTARQCQAIGFDLLDEVIAIFSRIVAVPGEAPRVFNHGHFWRRLAIARLRDRGWPVTLEQAEYVLVFQKPHATKGTPRDDKSGLSTALVGPSPHRTD
jgi:DNA modification methylase